MVLTIRTSLVTVLVGAVLALAATLAQHAYGQAGPDAATPPASEEQRPADQKSVPAPAAARNFPAAAASAPADLIDALRLPYPSPPSVVPPPPKTRAFRPAAPAAATASPPAVPGPGAITGGACFESELDPFPWPRPPPPTNQRVILKDYLATQDQAALIAAALSATRPGDTGLGGDTARPSRPPSVKAKATPGAAATSRGVTPLATVPAASLTTPLADFRPVVPRTLGHLLRYLRLRLVAAGYPAPAVLGAGCNGFALILEGERIRADGSRIGFEEWQRGRRLGFIEIIDKLMRGEPGFFRMITLVAAREKPLPGGKPISAQELRRLLMLGSSGLPAGMEDIPFDDRYELYALVYEFEKDAKGVSGQVEPAGRISILAHLRASGLLVAR